MTSSVLGIDTQTGQRIEIPKSSRLQGLYIIGATGQGKTGLIENLIIQDIEQGLGVGLLDPHGDLTNAVFASLPHHREQDVVLLDITDFHAPFGLNLVTCADITSPLELQRTVDQIMHVFAKLFDVSRSTPQLLEYLRNCAATLAVNPSTTLAEIPLLLHDEHCRKTLVANVTDSDVKLFWKRYEAKRPSDREEEASGVLRRVGEFLQPLSRSIVGQSSTTIDMRRIMDERKILLVKLDPRLEMATSLIGSVLIALLVNAAYSRTEVEVKKRKQFHLYADEFQRFATEDFATLLTEARKFGIGVTLAHQMRDQLDRQNRGATLNVANVVVFKVSGQDAQELAGEFDCTPPPAELKREEKLEPVRDVVSQLLRVGHPHPAVNAFVRAWNFAQLVSLAREDTPLGWVAEWIIDCFNDLLVTVMTTKNPRQIVPRKLLPLAADRLQLPFFDLGQYREYQLHQPFDFGRGKDISWDKYPNYPTAFASPFSSDVDWQLSLKIPSVFWHGDMDVWATRPYIYKMGHTVTYPDYILKGRPSTTTYPPRDYIWWLIEEYSTKEDWQPEPGQSWSDFLMLPNAKIQTVDTPLVWIETYTRLWEAEDEKGLVDAFATYETLVRAALKADIEHVIENFCQEMRFENEEELRSPEKLRSQQLSLSDKWGTSNEKLHIPPSSPTKKLKLRVVQYEGEETIYLAHDVAEEWIAELNQEIELAVEYVVAEKKPSFERFVREFRDVLEVLAKQPVTTGSGMYELVPGIQRTYQDVQNEIASQLANLPRFTARVKIAEDNTTVERTVKALTPERGLGKQALQTRIERIREQNIRDGYTRSRQEVEDEMQKRHETLRQVLQEPTQTISRRQAL